MIQHSLPHISIIIPVYNGAQYIAEALESVFQQDYASYEVIVVDDGSTDNTREVLEPYLNKIHYVYQENAGPAAARNEGIRLAVGEFIGFLDADDFFLPGALTEQIAVFERHPSTGAVVSGKRIVNQKKDRISDIEPWKRCETLTLKTIMLSLPIYLGTLIVRWRWVEALHGFDRQYRQAEDLDFFWRLALAGCRFAWLPKVTVAYRLHETNVTNDGCRALAYSKRLLETFFSDPDIPRNIRLLESQIWSQALLWHIWRLFFTGRVNDIASTLKELLSRQPSAPGGEMILVWMNHFQTWHLSHGRAPEEIRSLWPYIRQAVSDSNIRNRLDCLLDWTFAQKTGKEQTLYDLPALWRFLEGIEADLSLNLPLEAVLDGKYGAIGRGYFQEKEGWSCLEKLTRLQLFPQTDVIRFFQYLISKSSSQITVTQLQHLCHDLQEAEIIKYSETYLCTPLYLTLFGQALLAHHAWETAFRALYRTLEAGRFHLYAVKAWRQFFSNAISYWFRRKKRRRQFFSNAISYWFRRKKRHGRQRADEKKAFIILGQGRTGSTLLKSLLDSHSEIRCEGELFNSHCKYIQRPLLLRFLRWYPFPYLDYRKKRSMKPVYGCKILEQDQIKFFHTRIRQLQNKGWKIIHIRRKNVVRQVLSSLIAQKTTRWHRNEQEDIPVYSVRITASEVLPAVVSLLKAWEEESAFLTEIPHLSVLYEEDLQNEKDWDTTAEKLLNYLDLPWAQLSSNLVKTDSRPYSEIIENWDELRTGIQTIFQDFWEEE